MVTDLVDKLLPVAIANSQIEEANDKTPDFVLEITSKSTRSQDQGAKRGIYAFLGVREYFQYDPYVSIIQRQDKNY